MESNPDGQWLKAWRDRNGYTQDELAIELKVSRHSLIKWEKSEKLDHVIVLALVALESIEALRKISGRKSMINSTVQNGRRVA